jgi:uncharacterized membrane protein
MSRTASGLNIIAGLWLILSPFFLRYSAFGASTVNDVIVGIIVAILAIIAMNNPRNTWASWINLVLGLWVIIYPFTAHYGSISRVVANNVIVGIVIAALALASAVARPIRSPM